VGCAPLVENIATLIDPPGSTYDEATWIAEILAASDCSLLLDLHNLYANATNFGFDAREYLAYLPVERITSQVGNGSLVSVCWTTICTMSQTTFTSF
jgi:uncharacterized protein (UPF0276 family)